MFTDADLLSVLTRYEYTITAVTADGEGASVKTSALVNGPACKVPYVGDFSTWDECGQYWTVNNGNGATYNIMGQRIADDATGLVIKNGKKYLKR